MSSFLRRIAPAVLVGTAAVAVAGSAALDDSPALADSGTTGTTGSGGTSSTGGSGTASSGSSGSTSSSGSSGSTSSGSTSDSSAGSATTTTSCDSASEIVGPVVQTQWGPVQVAAKVSNGKVCAVRTIQTPSGDRKSIMINNSAVPILEQQVLAAGNASIDGVSGATYTTQGYKQSLQAILDQA